MPNIRILGFIAATPARNDGTGFLFHGTRPVLL
jgi:hypothetical protein